MLCDCNNLNSTSLLVHNFTRRSIPFLTGSSITCPTMNVNCGNKKRLNDQPFNGYKVHAIRFHTRARSANKKTYSCGVLVKGTTSSDSGGIDCYGVLEEVLRVEYPGDPIK